ncbi:hypothetical protein PIROE2DRAFT_19798 [Piromyces sp. E2]|nr:hypothetical protein PIROE2DRAFT_19798 [Piromyces sp. E2]|eukprot:OUM68863.1 hypothetical protein PIROE2DRAFT_19798 [Piromyces sp. E2]
MKYTFVTVLSIVFNVLLTKAQNEVSEKKLADYTINNEYTQAISFNSILEDINDFYNQNNKEQPQITANPNIKAQVMNGNTSSTGSTSSTSSNTNDGENGGKTTITEDGKINDNSTSNSNDNSSGNSTGNSNGNTTSGTTTTSNNNNGNNSSNSNTTNNNTTDNKDDKNKDDKKTEDDEDEELNVGDSCVHNRDSLVNSNFTIIWYYNKILPGYEYNYPVNNITFKLFYEDDANPNNWANAWNNPVFERTIPMSEVKEGPTIENGKTFLYNWDVIQDIEHGFKQSPKTNEKYKLRIYGDGKDAQSAQRDICYGDGDIIPGLTRSFYLVDNGRIIEKYYAPIPIEDDAMMNAKVSLFMTFIVSILLILYNW